MSAFISLLLTWGPTILHILGMLAVGIGVNNSSVAAGGASVPAALQTPLAAFGAVLHAIGLIISHRNTTAAKAEMPKPAAGESTLDHLFRLLASELATSEHADKLPDLSALIQKVKP
jgi:hypothetical protein